MSYIYTKEEYERVIDVNRFMGLSAFSRMSNASKPTKPPKPSSDAASASYIKYGKSLEKYENEMVVWEKVVRNARNVYTDICTKYEEEIIETFLPNIKKENAYNIIRYVMENTERNLHYFENEIDELTEWFKPKTERNWI